MKKLVLALLLVSGVQAHAASTCIVSTSTTAESVVVSCDGKQVRSVSKTDPSGEINKLRENGYTLFAQSGDYHEMIYTLIK